MINKRHSVQIHSLPFTGFIPFHSCIWNWYGLTRWIPHFISEQSLKIIMIMKLIINKTFSDRKSTWIELALQISLQQHLHTGGCWRRQGRALQSPPQGSHRLPPSKPVSTSRTASWAREWNIHMNSHEEIMLWAHGRTRMRPMLNSQGGKLRFTRALAEEE